MTLTVNHPTLKEQTVYCTTTSVGTTPIVAVARSPYRGKVVKVGGVINGAITADASIAYAIIPNGSTTGTAMTGSPFTIANAGSGPGTIGTGSPTGANTVNEDDLISFTPSGGSGATVMATFFAVIQTA